MSGFRAEQSVRDGKPVWILYNLDTQQIISIGDTVVEAVEKMQEEYEDD